MRRRLPAAAVLSLLVPLVSLSVGAEGDIPEPPKSPLAAEDARGLFRLDPGLTIELVAAEPQVRDPVASPSTSAAGSGSSRWRTTPTARPGATRPAARIKILEDADGDGRFEQADVFADGLLFANGLLPWRDGVIVTAAPSIVWLRDTDGDGRGRPSARCSIGGSRPRTPSSASATRRSGLDGWIYVANGLRGGKVVAAGRAGRRADRHERHGLPLRPGPRPRRGDLRHGAVSA